MTDILKKTEAFVRKWNGRFCDFDGYAGSQCVDAARTAFVEIHGCKKQPPGVIGAADFAGADFSGTGLRFLKCAERDVLIGDVVVYGKTEKNGYGHIAVCVGKLPACHLVLEQNGFTDRDGDGKADGVCYLDWRSLNVLGVIRAA